MARDDSRSQSQPSPAAPLGRLDVLAWARGTGRAARDRAKNQPWSRISLSTLGDRRVGLIRDTRVEKGGIGAIDLLREGQWVDTPDAIRYFVGIGGDETDVIKLTEDEARVQATSLGVALVLDERGSLRSAPGSLMA